MNNNKEISVIIIDDEQSARENIKDLLELIYPNQIRIVAEACNYTDAISVLRTQKSDLLFLDINLGGGKNGFELLESIDHDVYVRPIIISAYENFALKAFKYDVIDYILKPISIELFQNAIEKALSQNNLVSISQLATALSNYESVNKERSKIIVPNRVGWQVLQLSDICYLEAEGSYCKIHTLDKSIITASKNMKHIVEKIQEQIGENHIFYRVHKSFVVNVNQIHSFLGQENKIKMKNNSEIPITLTSKELTTNLIENWKFLIND